MTELEQALADAKMEAEIAKLEAETARIKANEKYRAEVDKLQAEARNIGVTTFLAPVLAAAGLMGATAALVKLFF